VATGNTNKTPQFMAAKVNGAKSRVPLSIHSFSFASFQLLGGTLLWNKKKGENEAKKWALREWPRRPSLAAVAELRCSAAVEIFGKIKITIKLISKKMFYRSKNF
jgi:hypothetical protein